MDLPHYFSRDLRRDERSWDDFSAITAFLDDRAVCRVALNGDPFPYVVPTSFRFVRDDARGDAFLLHCSRFGHFAKAVERDPHLCVVVDEAISLLKAPQAENTSFEYESVIARCVAEIERDGAAIERQQYELLEKYRPEGGFDPISPGVADHIIGIRARVVELTAKRRIVAEATRPEPAYRTFMFPPSGRLSTTVPR